jgi:hypothetical protein
MLSDKFLNLMITFKALISASEGESDSVTRKECRRRKIPSCILQTEF